MRVCECGPARSKGVSGRRARALGRVCVARAAAASGGARESGLRRAGERLLAARGAGAGGPRRRAARPPPPASSTPGPVARLVTARLDCGRSSRREGRGAGVGSVATGAPFSPLPSARPSLFPRAPARLLRGGVGGGLAEVTLSLCLPPPPPAPNEG